MGSRGGERERGEGKEERWRERERRGGERERGEERREKEREREGERGREREGKRERQRESTCMCVHGGGNANKKFVLQVKHYITKDRELIKISFHGNAC